MNSSWTAGGDTPLPQAVVPGGAASGRLPPRSATPGGLPSGGRVQFDMAPSPALTPSWKSTSWNKAKDSKGGAGGKAGVERSPDLRPDDAPEGEEFDEQVRRGGEGKLGRVWWGDGGAWGKGGPGAREGMEKLPELRPDVALEGEELDEQDPTKHVTRSIS